MLFFATDKKNMKKTRLSICSVLLILLACVWHPVTAGPVVQLTQATFQTTIATTQVVFVNFYADWCRFSQILAPIFEEAAKKIMTEFPQPGRVVFGKVDCDRETTVSTEYHISKYPTLKLYRNGEVVKREYRGQRSVDSLVDFMRDQLKIPVLEHSNLEELDELDEKKRHMIGYFETASSAGYATFGRVAGELRDDCVFHVAFGKVSEIERTSGDTIAYRAPKTRRQDQVYTGSFSDFNVMKRWAADKCVPLVREITFENAEELTEEGLPFLILFHHPDDTETPEKFSNECARQLLTEKSNVNFLTADGLRFTHPLHHLGKSASDLPVLAVDSFRHMYVFPHDVKSGMASPGLVKKFIEDLHSGKLHREFHHGPDPTEKAAIEQQPDDKAASDGQEAESTQHIPHDAVKDAKPVQKPKTPTQPPESSFVKLAPSRNRYTLLRDEL